MLAPGAAQTMGPTGSVDPLVAAILQGMNRKRLPPAQFNPATDVAHPDTDLVYRPTPGQLGLPPANVTLGGPMNLTGLLGAIVAQRPTQGPDPRMKAEVLHMLAGLR